MVFGMWQSVELMHLALFPCRPSIPPAFDHFQYFAYSKTGGVEGLGTRLNASFILHVSGGQHLLPL